MKPKLRSVVLLSGGLDSAANLALCSRQDEPVLALTVDYGQRAARQEIASARALSEHFGVEHHVVQIPWLGALGGSSLTDSSSSVPKLETSQLDDLTVTRESARSVWVPNRNGVLINLAAAFAEARNCAQVVVGFNIEEATTFPDNSLEFIELATRALGMSTSNHVRVGCYTALWDKKRIVAEVRRDLPAFPFERIWSCYFGGEKPCGQCESCRRFARALA